MTTITLSLPKGFSLEKLQNFAKLLDFEIIDYNEDADLSLTEEQIKSVKKGIEQVQQGKVKPNSEVRLKARQICGL